MTSTGAETLSPLSQHRSTHPTNEHGSPTRSCSYAINTASNRRQTAAAILDLDSRSTRFIGASLLEAIALSVGASRTPGGLQIAV
jgi:hypothetical protein